MNARESNTGTVRGAANRWRMGIAFALVAGASVLALSGCAGGNGVAVATPAMGLNCVDDSAHCINERQSTLQALVNSPDRSWIRQPASPQAYASGVRMFAYKKKKRQLSCEELRIGQNEAKGARASLRSAAASSLTPAQISRGTMFAGEVAVELRREIGRRCRKS